MFSEVTPTVNPTSSMGGGSDPSVVRNMTGCDHPERGMTTSAHTPLITDALNEPLVGGVQSNRLSNTENSVSTSTTVTELTMSPSGEAAPVVEPPTVVAPAKSNRNMNNAKNNRALQPHQGQNPTVERNTHKRSDEELTILGNTLVDKNLRLQPSAVGDNLHDADIFDTLADNLESSLVQNDTLQQRDSVGPMMNGFGSQATGPASQPVNPPPSIAYLQNHVNSSEPLVVRPKMPNVPGNGSVPSARPANSEKKSYKFPFKKSKSDKNKAERSNKVLSFPFFGRKSQGQSGTRNDSMDFYPTENLVHNPLPLAQSVLCKPGPSGRADDARGGPSHQRNLSRDIQGKSNLEPRPVSTEVRLMNGTPIVRPTSLPVESRGGANRNMATAAAGVPGYNIDQSSTQTTAEVKLAAAGRPRGPMTSRAPAHDVNENGSLDGAVALAEVGVAKLHPGPGLLQPALVKVKGKSQSSGDLSPTSNAAESASVHATDLASVQSPNYTALNSSSTSSSGSQMNNVGNNNRVTRPPNPLETSHNQLNAQKNGSGSTTSSENNKSLLNNSLEYIHATQSMDRHPRKRPKALLTAGVAAAGVKAGGRGTSLSDDRVISQSAGNVNCTTTVWPTDDDLEKGNKSAISLQQFGSLDINLQQVQDFKC